MDEYDPATDRRWAPTDVEEFRLNLGRYPQSAVPHSTNDIDRAVRARLRAEADAAEVDKRIAIARAYGQDDFGNGTVIRFEKRFAADGPAYTFVVLKVADKWYMTGAMFGGRAMTWRGLVEFLVSGLEPVQQYQVATRWEPVDDIQAAPTPRAANRA